MVVRLELWVLLIAAGASAGKLIAACLNAHAFHLRLKAQPARDAVVQQRDVLIFKFDYAITIEADQVIVLGLVEEIGIVIGLVPAKVHDAEEVALLQEAEGAVNSSAGDGTINFADHIQELLGVKMSVCSKSCLDDDIPLPGISQALRCDVLAESFFDSCVHYRAQSSQQPPG